MTAQADPTNSIPVDSLRTARRSIRGVALAFGQACRPAQWTKQVFVVAAPLVAGVLGRATAWEHFGIAVAAFCLAASAGYLYNDLRDVAADREHPRKRNRPIASGRVPLRFAWTMSIAMAAGAILLALVADSWQLGLVVAAYVALTFSYTRYFKQIAVVDVVAVAGCFAIRAIAGAVAVQVPVTHWFFIVVTMCSLYLVAGKREAEMAAVLNSGAKSRATLQDYSLNYLSTLRTVALAALLTSYVGWALTRDAADGSRIPWFALSVVPFIIAVLRYALQLDHGQGEDPEEIIRGDRPLVVAGLAVAVLVGLGTYVH